MFGVLNSEQVKFLDLFKKEDADKADLNSCLYQSLVSISDGVVQGYMCKTTDGWENIPNDFDLNSNLYFGVNLANVYCNSQRTNNDSIGMVATLYVEYDGKDLVDENTIEYKTMLDACHKKIEEERAQAGQSVDKKAQRGTLTRANTAARLAVFMADRQYYLDKLLAKIKEAAQDLIPSLIVFSGGGFHCYWFFDKAMYLTTNEERTLCASLQRNFVKVMGGDTSASDLARILRVPNTINTKYVDNNIVTIIEQNDLRYSFEQLEEFVSKKMPPKQKSSYRDNAPPPPSSSKSKSTVKPIPEATMVKLKELYPDPLEVFRRMGLFTSIDELKSLSKSWKIPGNRGLHVVKEGEEHFGTWHCFGEEYGGGVVHAWLYSGENEIRLPKLKADWIDEDHSHYRSAVVEMLKEKDVDLDSDFNIIYTTDEEKEMIKRFFASADPRSEFQDLKFIYRLVAENRQRKYASRGIEAKARLLNGISLFGLHELTDYNEKDEIVERAAYRGQITMLFAEPSSGKSYVAAEISTALILGETVLEQWITRPRTGIVLYIAAETDNDVKGRYFRIAARFKVGNDIFKDRFHYLNGDVDRVKIDDRDWVAEMVALYLHKYEALGQLPDLIIIDTFRTATTGGDMDANDSPDISKIMSNVKLLCKALGNAACILIHHTNRGKADYAGSGSFESDCAVLLFLQQSKEGVVSIISRKNKYVANDKKKVIFAAKFVQNVKDGLLEPHDPSTVPTPNDELKTDYRYELLSVIQDNSPLKREIKNLLVSKHKKDGADCIMNRCVRALSYLLNKDYITSSLGIKDADSKLTITAAGEVAMTEYEDSGGGISEEELP